MGEKKPPPQTTPTNHPRGRWLDGRNSVIVSLAQRRVERVEKRECSVGSVLCLCGCEMQRAERPSDHKYATWQCRSCLSWVCLDGTDVCGSCWTPESLPPVPRAHRRPRV